MTGKSIADLQKIDAQAWEETHLGRKPLWLNFNLGS